MAKAAPGKPIATAPMTCPLGATAIDLPNLLPRSMRWPRHRRACRFCSRGLMRPPPPSPPRRVPQVPCAPAPDVRASHRDSRLKIKSHSSQPEIHRATRSCGSMARLRISQSLSGGSRDVPAFLLSSLIVLLIFAASIPALGNVFATIHGVVHDPQHRPIASAKVTLQATDSAFALSATTDSEGPYELPQAPIGVYRLDQGPRLRGPRTLTIASGTNPVLHVSLRAPREASCRRPGAADSLPAVDSATPTTLITREDREPPAPAAPSAWR